MELSEYKNIFENEEDHFFYVSTHRMVLGLIKRYIRKGNLQILDAGCGTGGLGRKLESVGKVRGVDFSNEALKFARKRGLAVRKGSVESLPFGDGTFDVVTSIDVIYHKWVKNDMDALTEIRRVLKRRGFLILRVPANKYLYSGHDKQVMTARRYDKTELETKIRRAGLEVRQISYVHSPIFLMSLAKIFFEKLANRPHGSAVGKINPIINRCLTTVLNWEGWLIVAGISVPFGQGLIVVAQLE